MWADRVVLIAPLLDDDLRFLQAEEDLLVQTLVTKLAVERLTVAVLPWTARLDVERSGTEPGQPATDHLSGHLRSVVRTNVLRNAADEHNVGQCFNDAKTVDATGNPDGQAFAGILIDQGHEPDAATIMGLGFDKVIAPDVIAMPWPEPDARAVVQPEPASWPMFSGYLEPLTAPDPLDAITTDPPAGLDQQRGDPTIAIASVLGSQSDNRSRQRIFIRSDDRRVSLRSAWLANDLAGMAFGQTILFPNALDRPPAPFGAYKFPAATSFRICFSSDRSATRRLRRTFSRSSSFIRFA